MLIRQRLFCRAAGCNIVDIYSLMYLRNATRVFCLFVTLAALAFQTVQAQSLTTKSLTFGKVHTGTQKSLPLSVHLGKGNSLKVEVRIYGEGFSVDKAIYSLQRGGDTTIMVHFDPAQNLAYDGEIFLGVDGAFIMRADLKGDGQIKNSYYAATFNLWDKDLLDALETITSKGQTSLGYNTARDRMYGSLDNYGGKVTCAYTGRVATFSSRSGANSNSFNCEHTWPQSKFCSSESSFMKADIHHLFATDVNANSRRGSYPLGKVSGSTTWEEGGSKLGGNIFEPRDEQKGASARAVLYMVMRYGDCSSFLGSQESTLRSWSNDNAPSTKEVDRNDGIFSLQKNRNPFVDVPEFVDRIYSFKGNQTRKRTAAALAVDTLLQYAEIKGDSTIYLAYIVNTGDADFDLDDVATAGYSYSTSSKKVAPGEMLRIRIAVKDFQAGNEVTVSFLQSNIADIKLLLDLPMTVNRIEGTTETPLFHMLGNSIARPANSTEVVQLQIISLEGRIVYNGRLEEELNLSSLPLKGVFLVRGLASGRYHSQRIFIR